MTSPDTSSSSEIRIWIQKLAILLGILGIFYLFFILHSLIVSLFIAGFLTLMLHGLLEYAQKRHIGGGLTLSFVILATIALLAFIILTILPIFIEYIILGIQHFTAWLAQLQEAIRLNTLESLDLPIWVESAIIFLSTHIAMTELLDLIRSNLGSLPGFLTNQIQFLTTGGFSLIGGVGSFMTQFFLILILTVLLSLERREIGSFVYRLTPIAFRPSLVFGFQNILRILHAWIRGQLFLVMSMFLITLVGLTIIETVFGVDSGKIWALASIAGLMEFIPYIGPIIALLPALVVGLGFGWEMGLAILIFYMVVQQIENNFLVPYIMSRSLDLSPFVVFIVMIAGFLIGGILGIILAVPIAAILQFLITQWLEQRESRSSSDLLPQKQSKSECPPIHRKLLAKK